VSRALSGVGITVWLAVLGWAGLSLQAGAPGMSVAGAALAALAPLAFVCGLRRWALVSPRDPHPVMVSVVSGFGIVLGMVAVNRYGEQYESHVLAAGLALALWLIWVRWSWRVRSDTNA
jgi:hypothetical protein